MNIKFMKKALEIASKSGNDVPIGAIIVKNDEIVAAFHNEKEKRNDTTAHAEILAIQEASKKLNSWHLDDCELYVTLEPCPMCTGAIINSRIKTVIFGAYDLKAGCMDSVINLCDYPFNHKIEIEKYILKDECEGLLKEFFKFLREKHKIEKK